jgi:beta-lactamase regulating signal transducer with metallopeptidase domain
VHILLNWLVQGTLLALVAAVALRAVPAGRPQVRYSLAAAAYLLLLALPLVPMLLGRAANHTESTLAYASPVPKSVVVVPDEWWTSSVFMVGLWLVWFAVHAAHLAIATVAVRTARRNAVACPDAVLASLAQWSSVRNTGREARVVLSPDVSAAAVLGGGRPLIALAPAAIERLDASDLDRVLLHEWAHIQRRDDLAQVLQRGLRALIGWHPAAWWLERRIELEREAACDAIVVQLTGSPKGYAECLTRLAELPRAPIQSVPALSAAAPSQLYSRIVRVLTHTPTKGPARAIATMATAGVLAAAVGVSNLQVVALAFTPSLALPARPSPWNAANLAAISSATEQRVGPPAPARALVAPRVRTSSAPAPPLPLAPDDAPVPPTVLQVKPLPVDLGLERVAAAALSMPPPLPSSAVHDTVSSALEPPRPSERRPPWDAAADAGVNIGRASSKAGTATAGFFTRFGRKIAGSFSTH